MRVSVHLFAFDSVKFTKELQQQEKVLLQNAVESASENGVTQDQMHILKTYLQEISEGQLRKPLPQLIDALFCLLDGSFGSIEVISLSDWHHKYFEQLELISLPHSPVPFWMPHGNEAAPTAMLFTNGKVLSCAIGALQEANEQIQLHDEFTEAREELIELLSNIDADGEDCVLVSRLC